MAARTTAVREVALDKMHAADERDAVVTRARADRSGRPWTDDEDADVLEHPDDAARDVALHLGRTLWAVRTRRVALRRALAPDAGDR